jgi:acetoin utilization protein AcuB
MRDHRIRHLPVLDAGRLVGVVSDRDLHLIETLQDVDPEKVKVDEAMSTDPFVIDRRRALLDVVCEMVDHKYGSAIVVDGDRVIGVFTVVDALRLLSDLLQRGRTREAA